MSSVVISGDTSGAITVSAPLVAGTNTLTLQAATATSAVNTRATAVTASGTSVDFTGLPAWVERITVMFSGVSTSGTSNIQVQLGTGSTTYTTSGYGNNFSIQGSASITTSSATSGFVCVSPSVSTGVYSGQIIISNITGNTFTEVGQMGETNGSRITSSAGSIALAAALTAVRITTVNGTDTFDAGTINILYEG